MGSFKHQECMDVVQCEVFEYNLVNSQNKTSCWEMARQVKDFRYLYNICQDCIVYLFGQDNNVFTQNEMENILAKRNISSFDSRH